MTTSRKKEILLNITFYAVVAALFYLCFKVLIPLFLPFVIGFIIAVLLRPLTQFLCGRSKCSGKLCSIFVLLFVYTVVTVLLWFALTGFFGELTAIIQSLPEGYRQNIEPLIQTVSNWLDGLFSRFPPDVYAQISGLYTALEQSASSIVTTISTKLLESIPLLLKNLPNWILTAVFAVMSSFFFSLDYLDIMSFLTRQLPKRIRGIVFEAKTHFLGTVTKYLKAYTLLFLLTFVELFIGFWLIGIDYAATAAFLISFVDFLPVLGTGAVLLPWIFLEAAQGHFTLAIGLTVIFFATGAIRNVAEPKILGKQVGLHPLITLIAMYVGGKLFGLIGIFGVPFVVVILKNLHDSGRLHLYREKKTSQSN